MRQIWFSNHLRRANIEKWSKLPKTIVNKSISIRMIRKSLDSKQDRDSKGLVQNVVIETALQPAGQRIHQLVFLIFKKVLFLDY